jgi:hypothetical protein
MKRILICAAIALLAFIAPAQSVREWKQGFIYDPTSKAVSAAVSADVGSLSNVFGRKGLSLDLVSFVGASSSGTPTLGYAALAPFRVADQLTLRFGPTFRVSSDSKPTIGLGCFFSLRF